MEQARRNYVAALVAGMDRVARGEAWATNTGAERDAYIAAGANQEDVAAARAEAEAEAIPFDLYPGILFEDGREVRRVTDTYDPVDYGDDDDDLAQRA